MAKEKICLKIGPCVKSASPPFSFFSEKVTLFAPFHLNNYIQYRPKINKSKRFFNFICEIFNCYSFSKNILTNAFHYDKITPLTISGFSSFGRAPPCQGGGSGFDPRNPLQTKSAFQGRRIFLYYSFFIIHYSFNRILNE